MRRRSTLVALLAVLLHALAPLLANAAPGTAVEHVQLCTAQGVVTIAVESGGAPAGTSAAPDHCSVCAFHAAAALPVSIAQLQQAGASADVARAEPPLPRVPPSTTARQRAPPSYS